MYGTTLRKWSGLKLLCSVVIGFCFAVGTAVQALPQPDWTRVEASIIEEHNAVRQNPQSYIPLLEQYLASMDAQGNIPNGCGRNCTMLTTEGRSAVEEAIAFLQRQPSLNSLSRSEGVAQAAKSHARDQAGGITGHTGSNGSNPGQRFRQQGVRAMGWGENIAYGSFTAQDVVRSLIIDDGVADRGHRSNIFAPDWTHGGAGCGSHAVYGSVCVIGYTTQSQDQAEADLGDGQSLPAPTHNQLAVVHNGTVELRSLQIGGNDILGGVLAPGQSRNITLTSERCQADLRIQLGGQYMPLDWPGLSLCGSILTISGQNKFTLEY